MDVFFFFVDLMLYFFFFFFFQAEDGIRDYKVTGVQTCALPIYRMAERPRPVGHGPVDREREKRLPREARHRPREERDRHHSGRKQRPGAVAGSEPPEQADDRDREREDRALDPGLGRLSAEEERRCDQRVSKSARVPAAESACDQGDQQRADECAYDQQRGVG